MDLTKIDMITFRQLIEELEKDDDIENSILILQLIELNLEAEIEKDNTPSPQQEAKKQLKSQIDMMLEGFFSKPLEFLGESDNINQYVEKKTGLCLLPTTAEERSNKAGNILKAVAEKKLKKEKASQQNLKCKDRKELTQKLKEIRKEIAKQKEKEGPSMQ